LLKAELIVPVHKAYGKYGRWHYMKYITAIVVILFGFFTSASCQTSVDQECVSKTEIRGTNIVKYRTCGTQVIDTLKIFDRKGRLLEWQNYGPLDNLKDTIGLYVETYSGVLKITKGQFDVYGNKIGVWKYYHRKGYLWDEEEYSNGTRIRRTRYNKTGQIAFENNY